MHKQANPGYSDSLIEFNHTNCHYWNSVVILRRLVDIIVAVSMLLVLSLPILVIMIILRMTGEGEVFYFQERIGRFGKIFKITKFVTMVKDAPNQGARDITLSNDPRVLPVGRFLRRTKLNELPQLWDVLVGEISLVGWRPLMAKGFADYPEEVQRVLVTIKPGLTGIGSLVFRDEEKIIAKAESEGRDLRECYRKDIMPYKGALETWYVNHRTFWVDTKILFATAVALLSPSWIGYRSWFQSLPEPRSESIQEHLKIPRKIPSADSDR